MAVTSYASLKLRPGLPPGQKDLGENWTGGVTHYMIDCLLVLTNSTLTALGLLRKESSSVCAKSAEKDGS
jgi:hypothetical protein